VDSPRLSIARWFSFKRARERAKKIDGYGEKGIYKEIKEAARANKKASFSPTWNTVDFRSLLENFVG
jgi:hypothetical protein